jgi:hypothetical protein
MKVRVTLALEVDADAWANEYGMDDSNRRQMNAAVRDDVKEWLGNLVHETRHVADDLITNVEYS